MTGRFAASRSMAGAYTISTKLKSLQHNTELISVHVHELSDPDRSRNDEL